MIFYLGTHRLGHCRHFSHSFVSANILRKRKSNFEAQNWILDSGAFSEIRIHGGFRYPVTEYARQVNRWKSCGNLEIAVSQDYMCEPFMLKETGLTIIEHQQLTIGRYDELKPISDVLIMPVLQGYSVDNYIAHLNMYGDRLKPNMRVGVGSLCKRNSSLQEVIRILEAIKRERPDLKLHGFGLKITSLKSNYVWDLLYSADSMAWSDAARWNGRDANSLQEALLFYEQITNVGGSRATQLSLIY